MDALANLMPELERFGLTPEQQQKVLDYLDRNPGAMPEQLPVLSEEEIGGVTSMRRADASSDAARRRLERALARQQGAEADLMAGLSGPRSVPTPFGAVMVRQPPIMNIAKAIRAFRSSSDAGSAESELAGIDNQRAAGLGNYLGALNEKNRAGNQNSQREALIQAIRALGLGGA